MILLRRRRNLRRVPTTEEKPEVLFSWPLNQFDQLSCKTNLEQHDLDQHLPVWHNILDQHLDQHFGSTSSILDQHPTFWINILIFGSTFWINILHNIFNFGSTFWTNILPISHNNMFVGSTYWINIHTRLTQHLDQHGSTSWTTSVSRSWNKNMWSSDLKLI